MYIIWLSKIKWDLWKNVFILTFVGDLFEKLGTCLLSHLNAGALQLGDIVPAFEQA